MREYVIKQNQKLRCGFTTGSCAAAAAKAAAAMLLTQEYVDTVSLMTPKGILLQLKVQRAVLGRDHASCAIQKDSGDDPDVTDKILVYANAEKTKEQGVQVEGGTGVGRVTKEGLEQPVGAAAINATPRRMICGAVEEIMELFEYRDGLRIIISIPEGEEIAKKTFNPRLGIEGGISVLGTSGIVEPMSEDAIRETIRLEIRMRKAEGRNYILAVPGNYGERFAREHLHLDLEHGVKFSNYIGELIDYAVEEKLEGVLIAGHIGKLVKVAGGIMNTHSKNADARMEILTANALLCKAGAEQLERVMGFSTTEEAVEYLERIGLLDQTIERLLERMEFYLDQRCGGKLKIGLILFSSRLGELGKNQKAEEMKWYIS